MSFLRFVLSVACALGLALTPASAATAAELVMVEQAGCVWCAQFNADVAPEYPITPEGRAAPLRRIDLHEPIPAGLQIAGPLVVTPTFLLVVDGAEVARLEGYPTEDFFWPLLGRMLTEAGVPFDAPESGQ